MYSTTLSQLRKWHNWAKSLACSIGSTFVQSDNGPDSSLLCRELKWLMEDAVEGHSLISQMGVEDDKSVTMRTEIEERYNLWKQRIEERRPFQYIVGCEHWRDLVLSVQEGVLIPRPETEKLVDLVSDLVLKNEDLKRGIWADLGTGSGAVAIGIARILGNGGRVIATDLSPLALTVTAYNLQRYCLQVSVRLLLVTLILAHLVLLIAWLAESNHITNSLRLVMSTFSHPWLSQPAFSQKNIV